MSSTSPSKALVAGALLALAPSLALADGTSLVKGGYLDLTAENKSADLELGLKINAGGDLVSDHWELNIRPFLHAPFADEDEHLVRVDKQSRAAQVGLGIDYNVDTTGSTGPGYVARLSFDAELGTKTYSFKPVESTEKVTEQHQSFAANGEALFGYMAASAPMFMLYPQIAVSYSRSYKAADKIGLVVPGENGAPDTVEMRVASAPSVTPTLTLRAGVPVYHAGLGNFAFALFGVVQLSGTDYTPTGEGQTFRGELWTYFFPSTPNSRIGAALFVESARESADAEREHAMGLLVQLKLNADTFEY
jgi:hypothetical protein